MLYATVQKERIRHQIQIMRHLCTTRSGNRGIYMMIMVNARRNNAINMYTQGANCTHFVILCFAPHTFFSAIVSLTSQEEELYS